MTEWRKVTLDKLASSEPHALATGPFGSAISAKYFVETGMPVIRGSNLSLDVGVRLKDDDLAFLPAEKAEKFKRSIARRGDLVFTCWGTIGQVGLIDERSRFAEYVVSNKQMKMTPNVECVDSRFLYYLLSAPHMVAEVTGQSIGAAVPGFNLGQLRELRLTVPDLRTQRQIADLLSTIDDLIEKNRRRIGLLEQIAKAIYQEWFIRFRFPGHEAATMVDSPLGSIPEGWTCSSLGRTATWLSGGTPKTGQSLYWDGDIPWITSGTLTSLLLDHSERRVTAAGVENGTRLVPRDTLLFVVRGMSLVKEFRVGIADVPLAFGQDCKALIALPGVEPLYLAFTVISMRDEVQGMVELAGHGTGKLSTDRLKAIPLVIPTWSVQRTFVELISPMRESLSALRSDVGALIALRNLLLPKLVTGEIDVSGLDLDAAVAGTVV